jgi:hypothetical protein
VSHAAPVRHGKDDVAAGKATVAAVGAG